MLRKILLLVSLPFIALPSASFTASPAVAASLSSQPMSLTGLTSNKPVLISQYSLGESEEYRGSYRGIRRYCRELRREIRENSDSLSRRQRRYQWERYHRICDEIYRGDRPF